MKPIKQVGRTQAPAATKTTGGYGLPKPNKTTSVMQRNTSEEQAEIDSHLAAQAMKAMAVTKAVRRWSTLSAATSRGPSTANLDGDEGPSTSGKDGAK